MSSTLAAEPRKTGSRESEPASASNSARTESMGSPAGMPAFLQFMLAEPMVQHKCTECQEEDEVQTGAFKNGSAAVQHKCAACEQEEKEQQVQHKEGAPQSLGS